MCFKINGDVAETTMQMVWIQGTCALDMRQHRFHSTRLQALLQELARTDGVRRGAHLHRSTACS
jgi:hypothetical protein